MPQDSDFDPDRDDNEGLEARASGHRHSAGGGTQASVAEDGAASEDLEAEVCLGFQPWPTDCLSC